MVLRKLLGLADLTKAQTFCIHKSTKVVVVNKDKNFIFVAFQVVTPSLESLNDG